MAKVLVVDDDPDARELLATCLHRAAHEVRFVPDASDALASLIIDTPDVVILDLNMPEMDGITFLELIRCYLHSRSLPVILLTAYRDGPHVRRAVELGVRKTFVKSEFRLDDLAAHIAACTRRPAGGEATKAS